MSSRITQPVDSSPIDGGVSSSTAYFDARSVVPRRPRIVGVDGNKALLAFRAMLMDASEEPCSWLAQRCCWAEQKEELVDSLAIFGMGPFLDVHLEGSRHALKQATWATATSPEASLQKSSHVSKPVQQV